MNAVRLSASLVGLFLSTSALAVPSFSLSTSDPLVYTVGQGSAQLSVEFSVSLQPGDTADDVIVQFSNFVAYDPTVLKFDSIDFGTALDSANPAITDMTPLNYATLGVPLDSSITSTYALGTPDVSTAGSGYIDGSLLPSLRIEDAGFSAADLLTRQLTNAPALLFTVVFDVVTTQIGMSSILLLNDESFNPDITPPTFDSKTWSAGARDPIYPSSTVLQVSVNPAPAPGPLALLAAGLVGLAMRRRRTV